MVRQPSDTSKSAKQQLPAKLLTEWWWTVVVSAAALILTFILLRVQWDARYALLWLIGAAVASGITVGILRFRLSDNHPPDSPELLLNIGLATWMTMVRGLMQAFLVGLIVVPWPLGWLAWLPGILYSVAVVLDIFDGYVARRTNHSTVLGDKLDTDLDGLGILITPLLGVHYGQIPVWYLGVSAARYLFLLGLAYRRRRALPIYDLAPNILRRPLAGIQMGFLGVVLLPVYSPPGTWVAAAAMMTPFLISFAFDWLTVSGRINPDASIFQRSGQFVTQRLTVIVRMLTLIGGTLVTLSARELSASPLITTLMVGGLGLLTLLVAGGIAGRFTGLALLLTTGLYTTLAGLDMMSSLVIVTSTLTLNLGSGPFALWDREEVIFRTHYGGSDS